MKHLLLIFALQFALTMPNLSQITAALGKGDAEGLSKYFDSKVEIEILDNEDVYSKTDAKKIVKSFFAKHQPKSFNKVHQGQSKGKDGKYFIGNLKTGSKEYRVYIYTSTKGGKSLIQELRIYED